MTLKEIVSLIIDRNQDPARPTLFQIVIPGRDFPHGRTTLQQALSDSPSLEEYFGRIIQANKAEHLLVKLYTPNGSSFKPRGEHIIFLSPIKPVATTTEPATTVATENKQPLSGLENLQLQNTNKSPKMDSDDKIDYKVLQIKHQLLETENKKLEEQVKTLGKKVETLQDERVDLVKSQATSAEKHALELEKAKFEAAKDNKDTLGSVMDYAEKNPETVKLLVGLFKPDHPMLKESGVGNTDNKQIASKYHEDKDAHTVIDHLIALMREADGNTVVKVYMLAQKLLGGKDLLQKYFTEHFPEHAAKM